MRNGVIGDWEFRNSHILTSPYMAVGSISLASLLGLSKQNPALLSGHPAFEYGEENSLDE